MRGITRTTVLCLALWDGASAFVGTPLIGRSPTMGTRASPSMTVTPPPVETQHKKQQRCAESFASVDFEGVRESFDTTATARMLGASMAAIVPLLSGVAEAGAKGGEFGIIEGKTASFLHPIIMGILFTVSARSAILGLQWRELRTMSTRMNDLKAQLPMLSTGSRASTPLKRQADEIRQKLSELGEEAAEAAAGMKADLDTLISPAALEVEEQLNNMTARRKELSSKSVRDRHYDAGALLLGLGTFAAIEGPVNTYIRAQKLFPGPHLYAGAGCVVAWAVAASLVPQMQKGNDTARIAHMVINFGMIGLFAWQIWTGIPIAQKVWEFTKFP